MDQQILYVGVAFAVFLVIVLAVVIIRQQRMIKQLQQPRYGFLGKPLMAAAMTLLMGAGLIGGVYLINRETDPFQAQAGLNIELALTKELIAENGPTSAYNFMMTPTLNGVKYGNEAGATWNIYWNFNRAGSTQPVLTKSEIGLTGKNPSNIRVDLPKGSYTVFVSVDYRGKETKLVTYTESFVI
jgi:hypothetical protein